MGVRGQIAKWVNWRRDEGGFTAAEAEAVLKPTYESGDRWMGLFLAGHTVLGLGLAVVNQTWGWTLAVMAMALGVFALCYRLLPGSFTTRCVAGVALQMFVGLHVYQVRGLAEMQFLFFTSLTMMIIYRDWRCLWPGVVLLTGQHIVAAPMGSEGMLGLACHFGFGLVQVGLCAFWAVLLRRQTLNEARQQRDLREATEAKSAFLAMMSHEIRTPLNAITGMAQLLLDTPLGAQQSRYAGSVLDGAQGLAHIINDILDFSKIEARKLELEDRPFSPERLVRDAVELLKPLAQRKNLALRIETSKNLPRCLEGDPARMRQIVLNLLSNALKFTERGRVDVRVQWKEGGVLSLAVRDTGVGIATDKQHLLFEEFAQIHRQPGGTGLGLAITKRLAELMGGKVSFVSAEGLGSEFTVEIPMREGDEAQLAPRGVTKVAQLGGPMRVLVAEDNATNREIARAFLKKLGCEVEVAGNGVEAVTMWQSRRPDLILMDCQMPELDGLGATVRIREMEQAGERTPIVALTANAMSGDREACLEAGMDEYLTKPINLGQLGTMLERWMCGARGAGAC